MLCDQIESLEERKLNYISIGFSPELSERKTLCSLQFRFEYLVNNKLELFHFQYSEYIDDIASGLRKQKLCARFRLNKII